MKYYNNSYAGLWAGSSSDERNIRSFSAGSDQYDFEMHLVYETEKHENLVSQIIRLWTVGDSEQPCIFSYSVENGKFSGNEKTGITALKFLQTETGNPGSLSCLELF